ncbi:hypothetical protein E1B28_004120 [Marasmius oreades]|uniref:Peptidase C14 caspase domain-containing protein n=1 Tax=Marasmius oreades TaxID=181124 RepID=A0A9P7UXZ2_9AGAR|nr:uncharacterized protein E1B28_004120 [Marasmius oreades]KAG7096706.1 hypothetical protein E1B28_004120 [Marasmius oreades]
MQWDFTAGNNPPPLHRSTTPIPPIRRPTPAPTGYAVSSPPSHSSFGPPSFPDPSHMVRLPPSSAPSMTPAFLDVPGHVPTVTREGRSPERRHHHHRHHSHSSSRPLHERPQSHERHHPRVHSVDYGRSHSQDRHRSRERSRESDGHHARKRDVSREHHHHTQKRDVSREHRHQHHVQHHKREQRHSTSSARAPPNSKVVQHLNNGHLLQAIDAAAQLIDTRGNSHDQLAPVIAPVIKHVIKHLCRPCLHRHSESQAMELFYPSPEHPAYNPIPYPAPNSTFQYSRCTGRKRALCIGINYTGQDKPLRGCINDAIHVRDFLRKHHGFPTDQIMVLRDDSSNPRKQPTRRNMLAAMQWLVEGAQKNDSLFFHYSGHGGQTPDKDGDEIDGFDEVIYPVDYKKRGHILDDEMHKIMVKAIPSGCRLTALFDSCHSGTVLDLTYVYTPSGRKKGVHVSSRALQRMATRADVISWSGCRDDQTSADTFQGGQPVGAMSYAIINSLRKNPHPTYQGLLQHLKALLYDRFNQTPQLGSSHHIDTNLQFVI